VRRARRACLLSTGLAIALLVGACGGDGRSVDAFCREAGDLEQIDELTLEVDPSDDNAKRQRVDSTARQMHRVNDVAPTEVREATAVMAEFLDAILVAYETSDPRDPFERAAALAAAKNQVADRIDDASLDYTQYTARNCTPAPG
jgi:hypothetical protein